MDRRYGSSQLRRVAAVTILLSGIVLLSLVVGHAQEHAPSAQQNTCYLGLVVAQNQELGLLVLGMGRALAPSVSPGRPIEPFWPSVLVCMRPATAEEQALLEAAKVDSIP